MRNVTRECYSYALSLGTHILALSSVVLVLASIMGLPQYVGLLQCQIYQETGNSFEELPIFIREGISLVTVDIDLTDYIIS